MKFLHFHRDPNWQLDGAWRYYECKCGARRVERAYSNIISGARYGWPDTVDSHGVHRMASRWIPMPEDGWPPPETAPKIVPPPIGRPAGS